MIKADHKKIYHFFFDWYIPFLLKRNFRKIDYVGYLQSENRPMLIISNHFSWWDGFFIYRLNQLYTKKKFHVLMLEDQLKKRPFLSFLGAFSIRRSSRAMLESFAYAQEILKDPNNILLIYPQGRFESSYQNPLSFEQGWFELLSPALLSKVDIRFVAALSEYFSHPKPTLTIYMKKYVPSDFFSAYDIEDDYNNFYSSCIALQKEVI